MSSFKKSTYDVLMDYYREKGFERTVETARHMLASEVHRGDRLFFNHVHGEICEVVAVVTIEEFMRTHPEETKDWFVTKGTILRDPNNKGRKNYFTELDVTLFTPQRIYALECKCYGGDKKLQEVCTINRSGNKTDVFAQHRKHVEVLINNVDTARKQKGAMGYQLILFNFSEGTLVDQRTRENKMLMLCLDEKTLPNLLAMNKELPTVWDIKLLKRYLSIIERRKDEMSKEHLKYVTELNKKRRSGK